MELPLCFTCKHCKFAREKDKIDNFVWKIKCKRKIFALKISMNYPQIICCDYESKEKE